MRLITTREVAEFLKIANSPDIEPHIDTAQAEVQRYIKAKSLDLRAGITETKKVSESTDIIIVRDGPIAAVNSFAVDGVEIAIDDLDVKPWTVGFEGFPGSSVVINYDRGYTASTIPFDLKRTLIQVAAKISNSPNTNVVYRQERIGDHSLTEQTIQGIPGGTAASLTFPPEITVALDAYRKPLIA